MSPSRPQPVHDRADIDAIEYIVSLHDHTFRETVIKNLRLKPTLQQTADMLQDYSKDVSCRRIPHIISGLFGPQNRKRVYTCEQEKREKLRGLSCDEILFLGLSFKVEELIKFEREDIDHISTLLPSFKPIFHHLYRKEINKAVTIGCGKVTEPNQDLCNFIEGKSSSNHRALG
jgi:hypothetical protein